MKILSIDSTTEACSVALRTHAGTVSRYRETARGHSALLLAMVDEVMVEAGLDRHELQLVAFCRGPGSFTGVRIAAGVAQGLALGLGIGVAPVSTLACMAQRGYRQFGAKRVLSAIDARMGEVYWGAYELSTVGVMAPVMAEAVADPGAVAVPGGGGWSGFGSGWVSYAEVLRERVGGRLAGLPAPLLPSAEDALPLASRLAETDGIQSPAQAQPVYLRDRVTG